MKKLALLTLVVLAISVIVALAAEPVKKAEPAPAPAKVTVVGVVEKNKVDKKDVCSIKADDGVFEVPCVKVTKLVGKKVEATGTVKEADGKKLLTVSTVKEKKEPAPPAPPKTK
jgi:hypothetical protein